MKNNLYKQDVHTHTNFSDGENSVIEMSESAIRFSLKSIVISDHARGWTCNGNNKLEFFSTREKYINYIEQIKLAKEIYGNRLKIFSGLEVEVAIDESLKLDKGIIRYCRENKNIEKLGVDILLGSIHSESFEEDCKKLKISTRNRRIMLINNILNLIKNKDIDILSHPFQAIHGQFSNNFTKVETEKIINAFKKEWKCGHNIFFEINGKKHSRYENWTYNKYEKGELEINDITFLKIYKINGGKFALGSDAHSVQKIAEADFSIIDKMSLEKSDVFTFYAKK